MTAARKRAPEDVQTDLKHRARASRAAAEHVLKGKADDRTPQTCPVAKLGELLEQAWVNQDEVDAEETSKGGEAFKLLADAAMRRIQDLEVAISYARATSPAGMMVQLAVAMDGIDLAGSAWEEIDRRNAQERAERCLYSIANALHLSTGVEREPSCVGRYIAVRTDPYKETAEPSGKTAASVSPSAIPAVPAPLRKTVEERLVELNQQYDAYQSVDEVLGEFDVPRPTPERKETNDLAQVHLWRIERAILREAIALPATSVLALGLQARLIARVADEWWDEDRLNLEEEMCRIFLDKIIGTAGLSRIHLPDVTPEELSSWIRGPGTQPGGPRSHEARGQ